MDEARSETTPPDRGWLLAAVLSIALGFLFVAPALIPEPKVMLGIDGNHGVRVARDRVIDAGRSGWTRPYWFGDREHVGVHSFVPMLRLTDASTGMPLLCAGAWAAAVFFTAAALRRFGIGWIAAIFGGIAFGLTPHYVTLVYPSHLTVVTSVAFVALTFFLVARLVTCEGSPAQCIGLAAAAGASWGMMLNEDPQRGLYWSVVFVALAAFEVAPKLGTGATSALAATAMGGVCTAVALGVFAFHLDQWLGSRYVRGGEPVLHGMAAPNVDRGWQFATGWSHPPAELVDAVASGYHGEITGDPVRPYLGRKPVKHSSDAVGVIVVAMAGLGVAFCFGRERRVRFFTVVAVAATLLAMGGFWPGKGLYWMWYQLPGMALFRAPMKFMAITALALAVLAAYGVDALIGAVARHERARLALVRSATIALVAVAAMWLVLVALNRGAGGLDAMVHRNRVGALVWLVSMTAAVAVIAAMALRSAGSRRDAGIAGTLLVALLIVDLYRINSFYLRRTLVDEKDFFRETELGRFLAEHRHLGRAVLSLEVMVEGRMVPLALSGERGIVVTYMAPYFDLPLLDNVPQSRVAADDLALFANLLPEVGTDQRLDPTFVLELVEGQRRLWRLANVRYLVTDGFLYPGRGRPVPLAGALEHHPGLRRLGAFRGWSGRPLEVFELVEATGPVVFHPRWTVVGSFGEAMAVLRDPGFDPGRDAVVEGAPAAVSESRVGGIVRLVSADQDRVLVEADVPAPGLLTLSTRFDGGWRVEVDGVELPVLRAQGVLPAVLVEGGPHTVEWSYRPDLGLRLLSLGVLGGAILMLMVSMAVGRRRSRGTG